MAQRQQWVTMPAIDNAGYAVLVSGITSMGLEILSGRMLAPYFGSSVYTWGSIIGVFMAALSLGYHVGGKRAREHASYRSIGNILIYTVLYIAVLLLFAEPVLSGAELLPISARYAAILPAVFLFGPPVFLLGFISPYAAELSKKESTGEASGNVFAIGTVGSIIGAFLTTFVLIPTFAVETIALLFGVLAVLGALMVYGSSAITGRTVIAAVVLFGAFVVNTAGIPASGEAVHETQTPYQELKIADDDGVRTMYLNGHPQSAMYLNGSDGHVFRYTRYFHLPFLLHDNPDEIDRVLFIGGGGFTGPKRFVNEYDVTVDVVEIDPVVVSAAKKYFDVRESDDMNVYVMDGREYLQETDKTYDLIVLDAYKKDTAPFHLTTQEFMQLASSRLDDDGMLLSNVISTTSGDGSAFYHAQYKTMNQVFPTVYSFPTSSTPFSQNIELIATKQDTPVSREELEQRNRARDIGIDLSTAISYYRTDVDTGDADVLTDDKAPVDKLLDPLVGQRYVIEE